MGREKARVSQILTGERKSGRGGGRVVRFNLIFMNQSFDLAVKKILLVPKIELVFAESSV